MKPFPDKMTIGEKYEPAMKITDEAEAKEYFERCVEHTMRFPKIKDREEAEKIERSNLGYYAGYYSPEVGKRVNRLFGAVHPIFGTKTPTPEEAFEAGRKMAEDSK